MVPIVTVKLVVLYAQPSDPDAFDRHYLGTHMPLVRQIPVLERAESGRFTTALDLQPSLAPARDYLNRLHGEGAK